ncbi:MAG: NADH-quinone oxidoreductase subunit C [Dehalococcoidia bacterium]|nr:NADH-quinone oxidoreductase subunit C [Dehalococcoidia bacterium]
MTTSVDYNDLASQLQGQFGQGFTPAEDYVEVPCAFIAKAAEYMKNTLGFDYLGMVTAADYADHFEVIYQLQSIKTNSSALLKVRCPKDKPFVPSLANLWLGASLQEREVYDLFGIEFTEHPHLKRIVLWDGFKGYPLRKDFKGKAYGASD